MACKHICSQDAEYPANRGVVTCNHHYERARRRRWRSSLRSRAGWRGVCRASGSRRRPRCWSTRTRSSCSAGSPTSLPARGPTARQYREDTREQRIKISQEAQKKFEKPVSWGARCGEYGELFTHLSVPVMTRLRIRERQLLDALVDAGVARSRSHALAWCVRLVGQHQADWVKELQEAVAKVDALRAQGPKLN